MKHRSAFLQKYLIILYIVNIIKFCEYISIWIHRAFQLSFSGSSLMVKRPTISSLKLLLFILIRNTRVHFHFKSSHSTKIEQAIKISLMGNGHITVSCVFHQRFFHFLPTYVYICKCGTQIYVRQMIDGVHSFIQQLFTESQLCARNIPGAGN